MLAAFTFKAKLDRRLGTKQPSKNECRAFKGATGKSLVKLNVLEGQLKESQHASIVSPTAG